MIAGEQLQRLSSRATASWSTAMIVTPSPLKPSAARARSSGRPSVRASAAASANGRRAFSPARWQRLAQGEQELGALLVVVRGRETALAEAGRLFVGQRAHRGASGGERGVGAAARLQAVVGELAQPAGALERVGDPGVEADPASLAELLVERLAHERMGERVTAGPAGASRTICARAASSSASSGSLVEDPFEQLEVELAARDGGGGQHALGLRGEPGEAAADDVLDAFGDRQLGARIEREVPEDLLDVERVAAGLAVQPGRQLRRSRGAPGRPARPLARPGP